MQLPGVCVCSAVLACKVVWPLCAAQAFPPYKCAGFILHVCAVSVLLSLYVCCACAAVAGDRQEAAVKVAAAVGIAPSDVHAGIKPAGKAALVEQLKASGRKVAMVGDGINDTAALAAADVGMAMAGGVDAASDVAKVVLMGDQLHQVGLWAQVDHTATATATAAATVLSVQSWCALGTVTAWHSDGFTELHWSTAACVRPITLLTLVSHSSCV